MGWTSPDSWATKLFSGDPLVILLAFLVVIALPSLLHLYFYTQSARTKVIPTFLLLGLSGAGKTSLATLVSLVSICHWPMTNEYSYKSDRPIPKMQRRPLLEPRKYHGGSIYFFLPQCLWGPTNTARKTMFTGRTSNPPDIS